MEDQDTSNQIVSAAPNPPAPPKTAKPDWLRAIAAGIKGLPGGAILLEPLLQLRDQEKTAARNAELDAMLQQHQAITEQALAQVLEIRQNDTTARAQLELLIRILREAIDAEREHRAARQLRAVIAGALVTTKWPLPISRKLLMDEFRTLFERDCQVFLDCLTYAHFPIPETSSTARACDEFCREVPRQPNSVLHKAFEELSNRAPRSEILQFLQEYTAEVPQPDPTQPLR